MLGAIEGACRTSAKCRQSCDRSSGAQASRAGLLRFSFQPFPRSVLGTQIHPSCCAGVFVDQSAESVASVELVWRARTDEVWARPWYRWCQPESAMRPVGVVVVDGD